MKIRLCRIAMSGPCDRCTVPPWRSERLKGKLAGFLSTGEVVAAMESAKLGELITFVGDARELAGSYMAALVTLARTIMRKVERPPWMDRLRRERKSEALDDLGALDDLARVAFEEDAAAEDIAELVRGLVRPAARGATP